MRKYVVFFISVFLVIVGISTVIATVDFQRSIRTEQRMGYSSGKDCFNGECGQQVSFIDCVNCCVTRCPSWTEDCVDKCLEKFDPEGAYGGLAEAANTFKNTDSKDYTKFCRSIVLLKAAQRSKDPRIVRTARVMAKEAQDYSGRTGVLLETAQ